MSRHFFYPFIALVIALMVSVAYWLTPKVDTQTGSNVATDSNKVAISENKASLSSLAALKTKPQYIGSKACAECHDNQYALWQGSHHELAMNKATTETVMGDFKDTRFKNKSIESFFFTKDERFFIRSKAGDGKTTDFEVSHTFYIIPLELDICLNIVRFT